MGLSKAVQNQLYTIHCDSASTANCSNVVPVLCALVPNRKEKTYSRLLAAIKKTIFKFSFKVHYEMVFVNALMSLSISPRLCGGKYVWINGAVLGRSRN